MERLSAIHPTIMPARQTPHMKIVIEPTSELHNAVINDAIVPVRTWRGRTASGVEIEAYLLAVAPVAEADTAQLREEFPPFLLQSLAIKKIGEWPKKYRRLIPALHAGP